MLCRPYLPSQRTVQNQAVPVNQYTSVSPPWFLKQMKRIGSSGHPGINPFHKHISWDDSLTLSPQTARNCPVQADLHSIAFNFLHHLTCSYSRQKLLSAHRHTWAIVPQTAQCSCLYACIKVPQPANSLQLALFSPRYGRQLGAPVQLKITGLDNLALWFMTAQTLVIT